MRITIDVPSITFIIFNGIQKELGVTWDVDLYGELLKIGGGKER